MSPAPSSLYGATMALQLPSGLRGTESTLRIMQAFVHDTDHGQAVHDLATRIVAGIPDREAQLRAIFEFLRTNVTFKGDTAGNEVLRHPEQLVHEINERSITAGDCDDRSMLGAALVRAIGFHPAFIVMSRKPEPAGFEHVCYGAFVPSTTRPGGRDLRVFDPQLCAEPYKLAPHLRRKVFAV